jgi:hypothetical protein
MKGELVHEDGTPLSEKELKAIDFRNNHVIENYANSKMFFDSIVKEYGQPMTMAEFFNKANLNNDEPTKD